MGLIGKDLSQSAIKNGPIIRVYTFSLMKTVSDTIFDTIVTTDHDKPLIFITNLVPTKYQRLIHVLGDYHVKYQAPYRC